MSELLQTLDLAPGEQILWHERRRPRWWTFARHDGLSCWNGLAGLGCAGLFASAFGSRIAGWPSSAFDPVWVIPQVVVLGWVAKLARRWLAATALELTLTDRRLCLGAPGEAVEVELEEVRRIELAARAVVFRVEGRQVPQHLSRLPRGVSRLGPPGTTSLVFPDASDALHVIRGLRESGALPAHIEVFERGSAPPWPWRRAILLVLVTTIGAASAVLLVQAGYYSLGGALLVPTLATFLSALVAAFWSDELGA